MLNQLLVIVLALGLTCGTKIGFRRDERLAYNDRKPSISQRVTSGEDAKDGEFPYQVALYEHQIQVCGGVIISENIVLTAAHCVYYGRENPARFEIVAGITNIKKQGPNAQRSKVDKVICHYYYYGALGPNDIAIIFLTTPFKWTPYVQKVELPAAGKEFQGDAWLSGWGSISTTETGSYPDILQKAKVPIITYKECNDFYISGKVDLLSNICTGPLKGNISACSGDSGGPLVKEVKGEKFVIGLVSWGTIPCGRGSPTVFTKVSHFNEFLNTYIK